jgi:choline dehydrogenase-like flavoprotein
MLVDFRELESGQLFEADVCVVGAGAAGITLAHELAGTNRSVIVLESGGLDFERDVQDLYAGTNIHRYFSLTTSRFRMLGGTTHVWGGWCAPLDEIDFGVREWVPHSGWPITKQDLLPFYQRAQPYCELGRYRYDVSQWPSISADTLNLDPTKLAHRMWQLSPPTRFGSVYLAALSDASNVTVMLHATVVEISTDESATRARSVRIADLSGREATLRAKVFIVACGGIETARLLLASNRIEPAGLGNRSDALGRYFMEHPHPDAGGVLLTDHAASLRAYGVTTLGQRRVTVGIGPSADAQARLGILNSSVAVAQSLHSDPTDAWASLIKLSRAFRERRWPDSAGSHIFNVLRDLDDVVHEAYLRSADGEVRGFYLTARTEIAPNPSNRVTLDHERDALGVPRVRLNWNVSSLDRESVATTMRLIAEEFGRLGVGRLRVNELLFTDDNRWCENLSWFGHHMGTTRMSDDAGKGVVDSDCRVHGIANLYVASSSVFPTSGFANPTLTILALAVRLADHIKSTVLTGPTGAGNEIRRTWEHAHAEGLNS